MSEFECPVEECSMKLTNLHTRHFTARHGMTPSEWVKENLGEEIRRLYLEGYGCPYISKQWEWLSESTTYKIIKSFNIGRDFTEAANQEYKLKRQKQFISGVNNPSKRKEVREQISQKLTGKPGTEHTEETKQKLSDIHKGREMSEEHKENISKSLIGHEPFYPDPIKVELTGHMVRSEWERKFDLLLFESELEYFYEKTRYNLGKMSYRPDFFVSNKIIEIKGFADERSIQQAKLFLDKIDELDYSEYIVLGDEMPCHKYFDWEDREDLLDYLES